jgi:hypothetical protein
MLKDISTNPEEDHLCELSLGFFFHVSVMWQFPIQASSPRLSETYYVSFINQRRIVFEVPQELGHVNSRFYHYTMWL